MWGQRFTNLACLSSLISLSSKSATFSSSMPLFPHSSTSLHALLTIFDMPSVINMLQTVRFPFTAVHTMLATLTKLKWLVNHILLFIVHICDVRNIYKTWMACQSYFIVLTVAHVTHKMHTDYCPVCSSLRITPISYKARTCCKKGMASSAVDINLHTSLLSNNTKLSSKVDK